MPEGDTVHRWARRIDAALAGQEIEAASAPNRRSPLHARAGELRGATLERAEARGKHLLLHLSGERVVHSHLGVNGRWFVRPAGAPLRGRPWLILASATSAAIQSGGKLLRLTSAARARNDPVLMQLGPDPLAPGYDVDAALAALLAYEPSARVGEALLDQTLIAGIGNVIRIEACFSARVSPWRRIEALAPEEGAALLAAAGRVMETTLRTGRRPKRIYGRARFPCPRCGGRIRSHGQGDDNRLTLWCEGCQR